MKYLLHNLAELVERRAINIRSEAQLWDILSRDLKHAAKELDESKSKYQPTESKIEPPMQTPAVEDRVYIRVKEAMKVTGLGRTALYNEIKAGRIPVKKSGRKTLISMTDIYAWFNRLPNK